ncbi:hypothetical protein KSP35_03870 [Aquihabitans sp. G128]|uniref:hypothetical protein n=1 Tax=Aquihabitans sp. G128 TaxID=2849779 RepID=UPI001C22C983|nr:hypothetical protein [Aquihabitans sp. G128]QXC61967.1 hypothetical protein KSP35_03870 [Aquihabitans sp. G128]
MVRDGRLRALVVVGVLVASVLGGASSPVPAGAALDRTATPAYATKALDRGFVAVFGRHPNAASKAYWYPRLVETPNATWFALVLMDTAEYRAGRGELADAALVDRVYRDGAARAATASELALWQAAFRNGSQDRATFFGWAVEHLFGGTLARPRATVPCSTFRSGGLVPRCEAGGGGTQRDVSIVLVPGTNIYVDRSWYLEVDGLVALARKAGWNLQAERDPGTPSWMLSPGSWRSWDEQQWLYDHGYPANPPRPVDARVGAGDRPHLQRRPHPREPRLLGLGARPRPGVPGAPVHRGDVADASRGPALLHQRALSPGRKRSRSQGGRVGSWP